MPSIASLLTVIATSVSIASAGPIKPKLPPAGWKTDYLENYNVYHDRYIALSCQSQHDTTFFDDCCHPLLAVQTLAKDRKSECVPTEAQVAAAQPLLEAEANGTPIGSTPCIPSGSVTSSIPLDQPTTTSAPGENHNAEPTPTTATTPATATTAASEAPAPTTASDAPAPTQSSDAGNWSGAFTGPMTFFYQNGNAGSCEKVNSDADWGVAIQPQFNANGWLPGNSCGKMIEIKDLSSGKVVTAPVWDTCPTCEGDGIDASYGLFTQFASPGTGVVDVQWRFV